MKTLNSNEIAKIIPHRYPFALVDRVIDYEEGLWAKGIKCVSTNEMQFMGHFPELHIMPGVLVVEALAQLGAIAILSKQENRGKTAFFGGIDKCRFRKKIVPGDVIDMQCEIIKVRGNIGFGKAIARVDGKTAVKAELSFIIA